MFGYIRPCKNQIGEENYNIFNSYYCGLCKAMGKQCSQASRLSLNYDITFLAMMLSAVTDGTYNKKTEHCIVHPFKKMDCVRNDVSVDYSANVGTMLSYLKLADDWHDEKSIKALFGMVILRLGYNRAKRRYKDAYFVTKKCLDELSELEKENCSSIDIVADKFAKILEYLFAPDFIDSDDTKKALAWLGYNLGRWIYILDAINDIEKDYKEKSYNPFLAVYDNSDLTEYIKKVSTEQEATLTFTLGNIASSFDLLKVYKNNDALYRIIYDSLRLKQNSILNKEAQ